MSAAFGKLTRELETQIENYDRRCPFGQRGPKSESQMTISSEEIQAIAKLARIDLESIKIENLERDLNRILDFVQQMDSIDTDAVEPLANAAEYAAELRPDVVTETDQRERFQAIAPEVENGLYLVPKVID